MMGTGEIICEKVHASPRPPPKISFEDTWMKELGSEVGGCGKDSQQTQAKTKNPIVSTGRLLAEQPSGSSAQEIDKRVSLDYESTKVRTERPVESEQSIGLFTQREEIDIDFRVSGLPHAVVKQRNFRVRELVKKIESHTHRQALQADLKKKNSAYNPFSDES